MARPFYQPTDTSDLADSLDFDQKASNDIWSLGFGHAADQAIRGLSNLLKPPDPLPVVVSPRPQISTPEQMQATYQSGQTGQPVQDTSSVETGSTPPDSAVSSAPAGAPPPAGAQPAVMPSASALPGPSPAPQGDLQSYARQVAQRYGVDPDVFVRQINQESGFNPKAVSRSGAQGIAQFMPDTARGVGLADPFEPYSALDAAAKHMRDNLDHNHGDYRLALAAYNAGQGNVDKYGEGVFGADFASGQTRDYVNIILGPGGVKSTANPSPVMPSNGSAPSAASTSSQPSTSSMPSQPASSWGTSSTQTGSPTSSGPTVTYRDQWGNTFTVPKAAFDARPGGNKDVTVISTGASPAPVAQAQNTGGPPWTSKRGLSESPAPITTSPPPITASSSMGNTSELSNGQTTPSPVDPGPPDLMLRQPLSQPTSGPDSVPTWQDSQTEPATPPTDAPLGEGASAASAPAAPTQQPYPGAGAFQDDQTDSGYVQPDMAPGPPATQPIPQPAESPLKPVYDLAGNIKGYVDHGVQAASDAVSAAAPQIGPALNAAGLPDVATPVIKTARGTVQGVAESMTPEGTYLNQASDLGTWIGNGIRAATGRNPVETPKPTGAVAQAMDAARRAGYSLVSGTMQANVASDIWKEFGLPTTEIAGLEINPGVFLVPGRFAGGGVEAAAGPAAGRVAASKGFFDKATPLLSQGLVSAVSGGVGAATAQQLGDPNDPNRALKGFAAGAVAPYALSRGAAALARRAGREIPQAEGALANFGASPGYRPPAANKVAAEAARGPSEGEVLNRRVTAPASEVPRGVLAATGATDDRAGMRWAEDVLSDAAGSPRMRENDPARPSTQSRVNSGAIADERIKTDLEPAVVDAGRAGLQDELPQHLRDMHAKDILDEFYNRGYNESMAASQERIAKAQANNRPANIIQRLQQQAQIDADKAGTAKMRTRQGSNPKMSYENIEVRLQGQEQRLQASGKWDQLQTSAQAIWDHAAETRQRLVDAGEMDPADAAYYAQAYPHYVPTVPISHLDARAGGSVVSAGGPKVSRGTGNVVQALEDVGTSGGTLNPIVALRNQTVVAERAIQRNNVATAFAQMMDDALQASPGTMGVGSDHRTFLGGGTDVKFKANGQTQTLSVPKIVADGLEAASNMSADPGTLGRLWKKAMGVVTSSMTAGRASFLPVNLLRDAQDYAQRTSTLEGGPQHLAPVMGTWINEAGKAVSDIFRAQLTPRGAAGFGIGAAAGAAQGDENTTVGDRIRHAAEGGVAGTFLLGANKVAPTGAAREFLARGGGSGGISAHWGPGQRWYRDVMRDGGAPIRSVGDAARYLGDWASDIASLQGIKGINERTELISRTAAMRRAEKVRGLDPTEAMVAGRDASYDPDRAGTVARAINGIVPFFNASVQNAAQTARLFKQNPVAAAATMTATVAPPMLLAEAWNRSDPQRAAVYDDVPQYLKDTGLVVVTPWAGSDSRGSRPNYIWIPTGMATPFVVGMRAAMENVPGLEPTAGRVGTSPDASAFEKWGSVLNTTVQMFSPVRGETASGQLSALVPQGVKQGIELGINRDLYRGTPIVTDNADERASSFSRGVAGVANAAGRAIGNDWLQERRPSEVEHLVQAFPAQSDIVSGASDMVAPSGYKQAENRPIQNEPFVGGIASRFDRDTGGANLQRAQDARLPDSIRPVLEQAGMRPSDVGTVPASYKQAPLTRDEQLRWQNLTNSLMTREVLAATRSPEWRERGANKEQLVRDAMAKAREDAAARALSRLDDREIERRKRTDASRKAG